MFGLHGTEFLSAYAPDFVCRFMQSANRYLTWFYHDKNFSPHEIDMLWGLTIGCLILLLTRNRPAIGIFLLPYLVEHPNWFFAWLILHAAMLCPYLNAFFQVRLMMIKAILHFSSALIVLTANRREAIMIALVVCWAEFAIEISCTISRVGTMCLWIGSLDRNDSPVDTTKMNRVHLSPRDKESLALMTKGGDWLTKNLADLCDRGQVRIFKQICSDFSTALLIYAKLRGQHAGYNAA